MLAADAYTHPLPCAHNIRYTHVRRKPHTRVYISGSVGSGLSFAFFTPNLKFGWQIKMEINQEASRWTCSARHKITGPRRGRLSVPPLPGESCHLPMATPARGCLSSVLPPIAVTPELLAVTTQSAVKASTLPGRRGGEGFYSDNRFFNVHSETLLPLKFKLISTY